MQTPPRHAIYSYFSLVVISTWAMVVLLLNHLRIHWIQSQLRAILLPSIICNFPRPVFAIVLLIFFVRYHTNLSSVQYNVFFNLCRLKGVHFDLRERCGSAFVLLDSFSGGTVCIVI